jgi:SagB-type dehydrogenase family enzyme
MRTLEPVPASPCASGAPHAAGSDDCPPTTVVPETADRTRSARTTTPEPAAIARPTTAHSKTATPAAATPASKTATRESTSLPSTPMPIAAPVPAVTSFPLPEAATGIAVLPASPRPSAYPGAPESGGISARLYHAEHGGRPSFIDLAARRPGAKSYPEAEAIPLPYPPRARTGFQAHTPEGLGDLLALAYGVTRIEWGDNGGIRAGRPLPSGGAAYPGELYLAADFGLCHYLPSAHALERLRMADPRRQIVDALEAHPAERPELILLLTSRHGANLPAFGGFGHKVQTLDTGVLAGQALALIDAAGAEVSVHTRFDEAKLNRMLGLEPGVESVRAVVTAGLGRAAPVPVPAFSTDPGANRAGIPRRIMARHTAADGFEPVSVPLSRILEILDEAAGDIPSDIRTGHGAEYASLDLYCVANRVDGLAPACYRRSTATGALVKVRETTDPKTLFPTGGEAELAHFQAACALMIVGDYEHGYRVHGDRWYRMLNLQAGILAQRIGLAATGLGLGSMLRCDYEPKVADRLIHAAPGRTVLVTSLIGLERGVGKPGHRLLLGGYGS